MRSLLILFALGQQYLLMSPIQESFQTRNFSEFQSVCQQKIAVNMEDPFSQKGYQESGQFCIEFGRLLSSYLIENLEWSSIQVEETLAVQSLNLLLENRYSGKKIFYKLIFFMNKDQEWKVFYLRGLKI